MVWPVLKLYRYLKIFSLPTAHSCEIKICFGMKSNYWLTSVQMLHGWCPVNTEHWGFCNSITAAHQLKKKQCDNSNSYYMMSKTIQLYLLTNVHFQGIAPIEWIHTYVICMYVCMCVCEMVIITGNRKKKGTARIPILAVPQLGPRIVTCSNGTILSHAVRLNSFGSSGT